MSDREPGPRAPACAFHPVDASAFRSPAPIGGRHA